MATPRTDHQIQWIFFGIPNVLVNTDKLCFGIYQRLQKFLRQHGIQLSFEEILSSREDLILGHDDASPYLTLAKMYLSKQDYQLWHQAVHDDIRERIPKELILIEGVDEWILRLAEHYELGLIAVQPRETLQFLEKKKLLSFFRIHAVSGVVRINQPKKLMEWAVNKAGCSFDRCVMVGHRIQTEILPAHQLDMMTIQTLWPLKLRDYTPASAKGKMYLESLQRIEEWAIQSYSVKDYPDAIVQSPAGLWRAIQQLDGLS